MSAAEADLRKLQGAWYVASLEVDGLATAAEHLDGASITVRGDRFVSTGMGDDYEGRIVLLARTIPKSLNLEFTSGPPSGMRNLGIYRIDGGTWTLCLATRGDARPRMFATQPDSGYALQILQREPAVRLPETGLAAGTNEASSGAATEIEGEWRMVSGVLNGRTLAPDMARWVKRVTRGNVTQVIAGHQTMLDATFRLDATKDPHEIDYVNRAGGNKGLPQAGIYKFVNGVLHICVGPPGAGRPTEFASTAGDGCSYTVWRLPKA